MPPESFTFLPLTNPDHNDWQYKIGAAFLLAHDYGFKRVMSSYYFDNTDQGPPGSQPSPFPNACGNGWTCEHRFVSLNVGREDLKIFI